MKQTHLVQIGERYIGAGQPTFITFEAGPTHNGVESAKRLIDLAADSGADAIKFQIMDPERLVADKTQPFTYSVLVDRETGETKIAEEPLYDLLKRRALNSEQWAHLKEHADRRSLAFFATVGFEDEVDLVASIGCQSIKIASGDVNHWPLIRRAARTGLCLQLDTGNASLGEIEDAVDIIRSEGNENIIIHQCPSGYPAHLESINLNVIDTLRQMFPYPIAFSDHTPGWDMDVAAVTKGAALVEKTITEDRTTPSIEHIMSLEPREMAAFVRAVRDLEVALGSPRRILHDAERIKRKGIRRTVMLDRDAKAGTPLSKCGVIFRRPESGLTPAEYELYADRPLRCDMSAGSVITLSDIE